MADHLHPLHVTGSETPESLEIIERLAECSKLDARRRGYLHRVCDHVYLAGITHFREDGLGFDEHVEAVAARYRLGAPVRETRDWSVWNRLSRCFVCPDIHTWEDYHEGLMLRVSKACWATQMFRVHLDWLSKPSDGIGHPELGAGSLTRYINLPDAYINQRPNAYANVPLILPPPLDRLPVGSRRDGRRDGAVIGAEMGHADAISGAGLHRRDQAAPITRKEDGRIYGDEYRVGWHEGFIESYAGSYYGVLGMQEGERDGRRRGKEEARLGIPSLHTSQMYPKEEDLGPRAKVKAYRLAYHDGYLKEYTAAYNAQEGHPAERGDADVDDQFEDTPQAEEITDTAAAACSTPQPAKIHGRFAGVEPPSEMPSETAVAPEPASPLSPFGFDLTQPPTAGSGEGASEAVLCPSAEAQSEMCRALAKAIAFKRVRDGVSADEWGTRLIELLVQNEILMGEWVLN